MSVRDAANESDGEARDTLVEPCSDVRELREPPPIHLAGRYRIGARLGRGGSGTVYAAVDVETGASVAVKVLHPHLQARPDAVARFDREIRALHQVTHSAVVRVLDAGREPGGSLFLVMERLEGELLHTRMLCGIAPHEVLEIGRQLLGALHAAHQRGIVHRDIKPENLFLVSNPSGGIRLKILDFGIAKLTRPSAAVTFQTLDGLILGTPEYMSPEMCRGLPITEAADLWSAAASLYHALAGAPPFDDDSVGRLLLKIVRERAPSLAERRPDLPRPLTEAIDRALDPDPARRFPTARAFLLGLASGAPIDDLDWD